MSSWLALSGLTLLVTFLLMASRWPAGQRFFRWLPVPLWCYLLPVLFVTAGWLPAGDPIYAATTRLALPFALALLLLGVDLPAVLRLGGPALAAGAIGAVGIAGGAVLAYWLLRAHLPPEAWQGAGALAATWTGGSANLLAVRALLNVPDAIFAPLIVVDALAAYTWMAGLVAVSGAQSRIDVWLRARPLALPTSASSAQNSPGVRDTLWSPTGSAPGPCMTAPRGATSRPPERFCSTMPPTAIGRGAMAGLALTIAITLSAAAWWVARRFPTSAFVNSAQAWVILLVTTAALAASCARPIRRAGPSASQLGYPCLYLVLAATGAQASLAALAAAPAWLLFGVITVLVHGLLLLAAGRWLRLPVGLLATASQANVGGVVSGPLVGAVYHQALAPVGLLLAMAGNAVGTYVGWGVAMLCRSF